MSLDCPLIDFIDFVAISGSAMGRKVAMCRAVRQAGGDTGILEEAAETLLREWPLELRYQAAEWPGVLRIHSDDGVQKLRRQRKPEDDPGLLHYGRERAEIAVTVMYYRPRS